MVRSSYHADQQAHAAGLPGALPDSTGVAGAIV
jgi:hypothetical protein